MDEREVESVVAKMLRRPKLVVLVIIGLGIAAMVYHAVVQHAA